MRHQGYSSLAVVALQVVHLQHSLQRLLRFAMRKNGGVIAEVELEPALVEVANLHVLVVGEGAAGGIEVLHLFLEGEEVDSRQLVHEARCYNLDLRVFAEEEGE